MSAKDSYPKTRIWSAGRYDLWRIDRGVMGPRFELADDEYGQEYTPEEMAELRDVLSAELGAGWHG